MSVIWQQRYHAEDHRVFDREKFVAHTVSNTLARRIANALNIYKIRPRKKRTEKSSQSGSEKP